MSLSRTPPSHAQSPQPGPGFPPDRAPDSALSPAQPSSASTTPATASGRPGARLLRAGLALFAIGALAIVVAVVPFFAGAGDWPLWLNIAAMAAPVGLVLAVVGAWRGGRAEAREALRNL